MRNLARSRAPKGLRPTFGRLARAAGLRKPVSRLAHRLGLDIPSAKDLQNRRNLTQLQAIEKVLNQNGYSLREFKSILDFACGRGRLTQYLPWLAPNAKLFGCDTDGEVVEEARRRSPTATFFVNDVTPPLNCEEGQFDLVWSYSVFTSLSETGHQAWLAELGRTLRPGGVMLHTIHSYENLRRLAVFCPALLENFQLPEPVEDFIEAGRGYYYVPYGPSSPEYGLAIISQEYVAEKWPAFSGLRLVEHAVAAMEGYPSGPQDFVVMVK